MADQGEPLPKRIGDDDRDQAAGYLRDHLASGRITLEEFDERVNAVLVAKFARDIEAVFGDLPAPRPGLAAPTPSPVATPGAAVAARPQPKVPVVDRTGRALSIAAAAAWPLVIVFCFAVSWEYWWLIFIPIFLSSYAGKRMGNA